MATNAQKKKQNKKKRNNLTDGYGRLALFPHRFDNTKKLIFKIFVPCLSLFYFSRNTLKDQSGLVLHHSENRSESHLLWVLQHQDAFTFGKDCNSKRKKIKNETTLVCIRSRTKLQMLLRSLHLTCTKLSSLPFWPKHFSSFIKKYSEWPFCKPGKFSLMWKQCKKSHASICCSTA